MKRLSFNQGTLIFDGNQVRFEIPAKNVYVNSTDEIQKINKLDEIGIDCSAEMLPDEDKFVFNYSISSGLVPFERVRVDSASQIKLNAAEDLIRIGEMFTEQEELVTVFHPINIFITSEGKVKILYRGIKGLMPASGFDADPLLDQIKRLILLLFTGARFDELRLNGLPYANQRIREEYRRITKRILNAADFDEMRKVIDAEREEIKKVGEEPTKGAKANTPAVLPKGKKISPTKKNAIGSTPSPVMMIIIALLAVGLCSWFAFSIGRSQSTAEPASPSLQPEVLKGLRLASIQKYKAAAKHFAKVDYKKLSNEDRKAVLFSYLLSGQAQKALKLEPKFAESVVSYYVAIDGRGEMLKLKTPAPAIRFEKAWMKKDFSLIIQLKDQVTNTKRRSKMIIYAYVETKKKEEALQFAQKTGKKDLISYVKKISTSKK